MGLLDSIYSDFRRSDNIDDRRDRPDMTPEWRNVPGSLSAIATSLGNTFWGSPRLPEVPSSPLGEALGLSDIKLNRAVDSRSPLDQGIDSVTDVASMFRGPGEKLGSDVPFTQREFSKGYFAPQSFASMPPHQGGRGLVDSIIGAESGGDPNAKNPNSSATGAGQFISSTWLDTLKAARPDLAQGKSDQELLALRSDPQLSREMTEAYAAQNGAILSKAGHPVTPGSTYLAHFAGPQGAVSVLGADPSTPIDRVLTPAAIKANPFLQGMTAGDLRAWADRKMGGGQTAQASPAAPANAAPAQPPLNLIPQQAPPIFAPPPQQQPRPQPDQSGALFEQIPQMQAPPIFTPQRRSPDLSKLRAAFQQQAPIFRRG